MIDFIFGMHTTMKPFQMIAMINLIDLVHVVLNMIAIFRY